MNIDDIKRNSNLNLNEFKHFLMCYFNMSADYADLENLVDEYKQKEPKSDVKKLLDEIKLITSLNEWDTARILIEKYGDRFPGKQNLKWIIDTISRKLNEK